MGVDLILTVLVIVAVIALILFTGSTRPRRVLKARDRS